MDVSELVFEVLRASTTREVVALGSAFPSPLLFSAGAAGPVGGGHGPGARPLEHGGRPLQGNPDLRRQIALRYLADGLQVPGEEIVITHGALEALNLCLSAVTRPGDAVVVEAPRFTPPCRRWSAWACTPSKCPPIRAKALTWGRWSMPSCATAPRRAG